MLVVIACAARLCGTAPAPAAGLGGRDHATGRTYHFSLMRFYLTTPIYYVNSTPHIGHAYTTIAADILVRHHRQRGDDTFFLTGVDEHATNVARVARSQGLEPQEYADRIAVVWQELPERLNASNDFFIRTSDEGHKAFVREFLQRIYDNGDVYEDVYAGWYCVGCEAFKTEEELVDGKCPIHGGRAEWIEEKNYFFRLSAYQDKLLEHLRRAARFRAAAVPLQRGPQLHRGRPARLLDQPRRPGPGASRCRGIQSRSPTSGPTRSSTTCSALTYARPGEDLDRFWPAVRHLLAKDILRFHCVFWPAMLLAAGYEVPQQLFVHGYLLIDDQKISKCQGNVIDPLELIDVYGADAVRFWCARAVSFGQDGTASLDDIRERYERELGNDLGNLLSRTTAMIARYRGGTLRKTPGSGRDRRRGVCAPRWSLVSTGSTSRARSRRSGSRSGGSTSTSRRTHPGSSPRTRPRRASSTRSSTTSPTASAPSRSPSRRTYPRPRRGSWTRSANPPTSRSTASGRRPPRRPTGIEPAPPLFPRVEEPTPA